MSRITMAAPIVVLCVLTVAVPSVRAYWIGNGVAVCTATGPLQEIPNTCSDGEGGVIVAWQDNRNGNYDIFVQRVSASGRVLWTAGGVSLCTAGQDQSYPTIVSDGAGGAIVTWQDYRGADLDIYAQRVDASGAVQWAANGVALCAEANDQSFPKITSDGAGGGIVTWQDGRGSGLDVYAQRVNASGTFWWNENGVALCALAGAQQSPVIASDGAGGAIIAWQDYRYGVSGDIFAQRVDASGALQWAPVHGVILSIAPQNQIFPNIISDGAGGAIVTWQDYRGANQDIYAQRVNASGATQWAPDGSVICAATEDQLYPVIASDGAGGAIVTWMDYRGVDIYAQRVNASGALQWTPDGVVISAATQGQTYPIIISDGAGGAIIAWNDGRNGNADIYAQRVNASGAVRWTSDGVALCTAAGTQSYPAIAADGASGAVVAWQDERSGSQVYAQAIDASGRAGFLAPTVYAVSDVPGDQGGRVNLAWDASRADHFSGDITRYTIWRALDTPAALMMIENGADLLSGPERIPSTAGKPLVRMEQVGGQTFYWSLIDSHDAYYLENYSKIVATAFDSSATTEQYNYFQIIAHTSDPRTFFVSAPDSGRSVDNLAPYPPVGLAGAQSYAPEGLELTWDRNSEEDLGHYAVYRGASAGFVPGPANLIASPQDTVLFDEGWRWEGGFYYKVSAVDVHGNESGFALLSPDNITGVETPASPLENYVAQNFPNPFNPTTRIAFGLSGSANVSLRIYDVAGRLVRTLAEGNRPAGHHAETWDGRNMRGEAMASGIYFYRLDAGAFTQTKKMILLR